MSDESWKAGFARCLGVRLDGEIIGEVDEHGKLIVGDTLILLLNAHYEPMPFNLPTTKGDLKWQVLIDTAALPAAGTEIDGLKYELKGRSMAVLLVPRVPAEEAANGQTNNGAAAAKPAQSASPDASGVANATAVRDQKAPTQQAVTA